MRPKEMKSFELNLNFSHKHFSNKFDIKKFFSNEITVQLTFTYILND
jgi:hypothetical protein